MGKSIDKVLEPVLNEIHLEGLSARWEQERELKKVRKNRRNLNRSIREKKAIKETPNMPQGKGKKHFVLTHMDENQDRPETEAFYQGEYEIDQFPVKVSYWKDDYLIVPSWFDTEKAAQEYIKNVYEHISADFYMVQERHYAKGDPRMADAKIIGSIKDVDFCPQPSRGKTQEKSGEPMIDVWTMWFRGLDLAEQYVSAFNKDIAAAKAISNIPCSPFPGLPHGM